MNVTNQTKLLEGETLIESLRIINDMSYGIAFNILPFIIFFIVLIRMVSLEYKPRDSFIVSCFSGLLVSSILKAINLVSDSVYALFIILCGISIYLILKD